MPTVGRIDTHKGNQEEATREVREKPGGSEAKGSKCFWEEFAVLEGEESKA